MSDYSSLFIPVSAETLNSNATFSAFHTLHYTPAGMKGYIQELQQLLCKVNCALLKGGENIHKSRRGSLLQKQRTDQGQAFRNHCCLHSALLPSENPPQYHVSYDSDVGIKQILYQFPLFRKLEIIWLKTAALTAWTLIDSLIRQKAAKKMRFSNSQWCKEMSVPYKGCAQIMFSQH